MIDSMQRESVEARRVTLVVDAPPCTVMPRRWSLVHAAAECRCGHAADAHRHYRSGTDCALCDCARLLRR
jgi:hypothetical protein